MAPSMAANFLRCMASSATILARMLLVRAPSLLPRTLPLIGIVPVNFINHQDPNHPNGSTAQSLLSNISWPRYTLDSKQMLLFSDDAAEEYTTVPDTYRAGAISAMINTQAALRRARATVFTDQVSCASGFIPGWHNEPPC